MKKLLLFMGLLGISYFVNAQTALNEGFEGVTFPPTGWTLQNTHPTKNWVRTTNSISGAGSALVNWDVAAQDESLISPTFSLVGYNSAYLNFTAVVGYEYMVAPFANGDLMAEISTNGGLSWTVLWVEEDEGVYEDYAPRYKHINLSSYLGQANLKIRFHYVATDADSVRIDDVSVTSCPTIDSLQATSITDTGAAFSWTGTAASYDVEWGAVGFTQGTGTVVNVTTPAFTFPLLTPGTGYSFYIKANCSGTSNSGYTGPYTFYTPLLTPTDTPYSYGWDTTGTLESNGWSALEVSPTGGFWDQYTGLPQAGTGMAAALGSTGGVSNAWMFSRGLNLTAGSTLTITYYRRKYTGAGTGGTNNLAVSIGTDKTVAAQTTTLSALAAVTSTTYAQQTHTFTAPTTGVYYVGFNYTSAAQTSANNGGILIDSFVATSTAGTNDFLAAQLSIYPNPATNVINVSNADNILVSGIEIVDLNGRTVKTAKFDGVTEAQINISDLSAGMYMMTVSSDQGTLTKKIVKQ